MKKIKQLLLALVASFGALTTCAELSVNGTIVHNGAKGDGWEYSDYRVWLKDSGKTYTITGEDYARRIGIHVKAKNCKMIADNLVLCPTNGNHYAGIKLDDDVKNLSFELELRARRRDDLCFRR